MGLTHVNAANLDRELGLLLLDPTRPFAIVLVSPPPRGSTLRLDIETLGATLGSNYRVFIMSDDVAAKRLADLLTKRGFPNTPNKNWICFGGAVRLYLPHMKNSDSPGRHPFWKRAALESHADPTTFLVREIRARKIERRQETEGQLPIKCTPQPQQSRAPKKQPEIAKPGLTTAFRLLDSDTERVLACLRRMGGEQVGLAELQDLPAPDEVDGARIGWRINTILARLKQLGLAEYDGDNAWAVRSKKKGA